MPSLFLGTRVYHFHHTSRHQILPQYKSSLLLPERIEGPEEQACFNTCSFRLIIVHVCKKHGVVIDFIFVSGLKERNCTSKITDGTIAKTHIYFVGGLCIQGTIDMCRLAKSKITVTWHNKLIGHWKTKPPRIGKKISPFFPTR